MSRFLEAKPAQRVAMLAPLLIAVPVISGIVTSIWRLHGAVHPYAAWSPNTNASVTAYFLGDATYQNPGDGFTGGIFPPLLPLIAAALDKVHYWSAWSILLTLAGSIAVAGVAGRLAYRPLGPGWREHAFAVVGAIGFAGVAWWLATTLSNPFLFDGRADQPAWALALIGLVCVPRGVTTSWRAWTAALVLITAAIWTKQTSVLTAGVAVGWVAVAIVLGAVDRRKAISFVVALGVINGLIYLLLQILTDGWFHFFAVEIAQKEAITATTSAVWDEFWRRLIVPVTITFLLTIAACLSIPRERWARLLAGDLLARLRAAVREPGDLAIVTIVGTFVIVAAIGAIYARRKMGTTDNQYIGVVWGLALLAAVAYRRASLRAVGAIAASVVVVGIVLVCQDHTLTAKWYARGTVVPKLNPAVHWSQVPLDVKRYATDHSVYVTTQPDINYWAGARQPRDERRAIYPSWADMADLLAAGGKPTYLVDALLDRKFDAVTPLPDDAGYASSYGKTEESYFWKVNEVINAGYSAAPGVPAGLLQRTPGAPKQRWMRTCFGSLRAADGPFEIGHGGGFWCTLSGGESRVTLVRTPAATTEIRSAHALHGLAGSLRVRVPAAGTLTINAGGAAPDAVRLIGVVGPRSATLTQFVGTQATGKLTLRRRHRRAPVGLVLNFAGGLAAAPAGAPGGAVTVRFGASLPHGPLALGASQGSRVTYDLGRLQVDAG